MNSTSPVRSPALFDRRLQDLIVLTLMSSLLLLAAGAWIRWRGQTAEFPDETSPPVFLVNLNRAGVSELKLLPGIGPATAKLILHDRRSRGPFESIEDLDRVPGIGLKTVEAVRPYCQAIKSPVPGQSHR